MKFIDIVFNENGNVIYQNLPEGGINQYATDYQVRVAFTENFNTDELRYISAVIKTSKNLPERILYTVLGNNITMETDTETITFENAYSYNFTFYDTQFYQPSLELTVCVKLLNGIEFNSGIIYIPMNKAEYSKPTILPLDYDSTLESVLVASNNAITNMANYLNNPENLGSILALYSHNINLLDLEEGIDLHFSFISKNPEINKDNLIRILRGYGEIPATGIIVNRGNIVSVKTSENNELEINYWDIVPDSIDARFTVAYSIASDDKLKIDSKQIF